MLSQDISCGLHLPGGKNEKEYFPGDAELYTTDWVEGGGDVIFYPSFIPCYDRPVLVQSHKNIDIKNCWVQELNRISLLRNNSHNEHVTVKKTICCLLEGTSQTTRRTYCTI